MSALPNDPKADGSNPAEPRNLPEPRKDGELDDRQLDQASGGTTAAGAVLKPGPAPGPPPLGG